MLESRVVFNPAAGRGKAARQLAEWRQQLAGRAEFCPTNHPGHGEQLAESAARAGCSVVAAAGGDGTVHEVANGLLRANCPEVTFVVLPSGSANDYAYSLRHEFAETPDVARLVDVGSARAPDGRQRYFVNGLGLGFNGAVTLEARRIRWLRGLPLYGLAFMRALCFRYGCPRLRIELDGVARDVPTFGLTLALGRREGNFVVAPRASLVDGQFDYLHAGRLTRLQALRLMPRLASGRPLPDDYPEIWQGHAHEASIRGRSTLTVHLDGEFFSRPEDGICELEVKLHPGALRVLPSCDSWLGKG